MVNDKGGSMSFIFYITIGLCLVVVFMLGFHCGIKYSNKQFGKLLDGVERRRITNV